MIAEELAGGGSVRGGSLTSVLSVVVMVVVFLSVMVT